MNTTIKITQKNIGETDGSVGWLANQSKSVKFSTTSKGYRAAFLTIGEKTEIVICQNLDWCLACGHIENDGVFQWINRHHCPYANVSPDFEVQWTDAAWTSYEDMVNLIQEKFEQWLEDSGQISWTISESK